MSSLRACFLVFTLGAVMFAPATGADPALADAPAVVAADAAAECTRLADIVADVCPQRCMRKHCTQRCIPPLNEDGRCGRCQDHCARICESQADMRREACPPAADDTAPTAAAERVGD